jgi:hypothetical protein
MTYCVILKCGTDPEYDGGQIAEPNTLHLYSFLRSTLQTNITRIEGKNKLTSSCLVIDTSLKSIF